MQRICFVLIIYDIRFMKIAVGSTRESKLSAVRNGVARIAGVAPEWKDAEILGRAIEFDCPAMPLSDDQLIAGARARALAVRASLAAESSFADYYVGLEGGFHALVVDNIEHTFLRGWVCVFDGQQQVFRQHGFDKRAGMVGEACD
jgi:non-canonical (house-cleaning) NTP pyrophosphatase